jgi:hypothetical protein
VTSTQANASEYRAITSWVSAKVAPRSDWIDGIATMVMVTSSSCMKTADSTTTRISQRPEADVSGPSRSEGGVRPANASSGSVLPCSGEDMCTSCQEFDSDKILHPVNKRVTDAHLTATGRERLIRSYSSTRPKNSVPAPAYADGR